MSDWILPNAQVICRGEIYLVYTHLIIDGVKKRAGTQCGHTKSSEISTLHVYDNVNECESLSRV